MKANKIWLLKFPIRLYKEDVKKLAVENNLKIIDDKFADSVSDSDVESKPPKLTLVAKKQRKPKVEKKEVKEE